MYDEILQKFVEEFAKPETMPFMFGVWIYGLFYLVRNYVSLCGRLLRKLQPLCIRLADRLKRKKSDSDISE